MWMRKFGDAASEFLPCGVQRALSPCRPWKPERGPTSCSPVALGFKGSERGHSWAL